MSNEESELLGEIDVYYERLTKEASASGYHLNPYMQFTKALIAGLIVNEKRYGYRSCPCRLAAGNRAKTLTSSAPAIIGTLTSPSLALAIARFTYRKLWRKAKKQFSTIPERRLPPGGRATEKTTVSRARIEGLVYPVWRCKVCGYLCAREGPPEICPICKAKQGTL